MKQLILSFFILTGLTAIVSADPVTFEATVNSPRISLDEVMQLTLTVTGVNNNLAPISLPVLDGFSAKYLGPSTSVSIVNGDYHSEKSFIYDLFPNRVGRFQIPPISANISGQTYTTKPIDVEVTQNTTQSQSPAQGQNDQVPSAETLKDKIKIIVSIPKTNVYLDERVPLSIKLLVSGVPVRDIQYPQFPQQGFTMDSFDRPQQGSQIINGVNYDTVEFKVYIYPSQLGDLVIGPVQIQGNVLYKTGQGNPFGGDNDFFGTNVLNGFFDSYANRPVTITSDPLTLHVQALPEDNRPNDFSGAVGQFDFHTAVSPLQIKAGDPLTLKMSVEGDGNFKNMKMPAFEAPGFKSYSPQIKTEGNKKTAEEVIIPTSADIKEVPALNFSYFDTSLQNYKTITQGPFAIQVTAPNPESEFKAVGFSDVSKESAAPPSYWDGILKKAYHLIKKLCLSLWFWLGFACVMVAGISFSFWRKFQDRLAHDPAFARKLRALKEARETLTEAEGKISTGNPKEFYAFASKALRDYLADKWAQPAAALSNNDILSRLKDSQADEAAIAQVKNLFEQSDMVCFAGAAVDADKMRADLREVRSLIDRLEKII